MTDLRVLQEGRLHRTAREAERRRRRRRRRIRGLARLAVLAVLVLAVLLAALASAVSGPPRHRAMAAGGHLRAVAGHGVAPLHHATNRIIYGRTLDRVQVGDPHLKLPLRSGLLFDVRTGRVLWERKPSWMLPIASLTKMMTALVVIEHSGPNARVLITRQAEDFSGSGVGLLPLHKRVTELTLLYGLLLPSGNDAAIALAEHVASTQTAFVSLMNRTAVRMGLTCTHFSSVSGLIDQGNHSCARDLAVLAHAVLRQPLLARIVASRSAILPFPIKGGRLYLYNNNPLLLERYPGADGVKTGFTTASGLCLAAAARRGHEWLGVVLLHSANWASQATALLDAGFAALTPRTSRARARALTRSAR